MIVLWWTVSVSPSSVASDPHGPATLQPSHLKSTTVFDSRYMPEYVPLVPNCSSNVPLSYSTKREHRVYPAAGREDSANAYTRAGFAIAENAQAVCVGVVGMKT